MSKIERNSNPVKKSTVPRDRKLMLDHLIEVHGIKISNEEAAEIIHSLEHRPRRRRKSNPLAFPIFKHEH